MEISFLDKHKLMTSSKTFFSKLIKLILIWIEIQQLWPWEFFGYVAEKPGTGVGQGGYFRRFEVISDE